MTPSRQAVAAEALGWLGTPYAHRQRLKGVGVDCAQLPLAVYAACGLIADPDVGAYATQWHLHRGEELYLGHVLRLGGREIGRGAAQAGDLGLWRYGRTFSHGGVLIGDGRLVHAVRDRGVVLADLDIDTALTSRLARFFTLFDFSATEAS